MWVAAKLDCCLPVVVFYENVHIFFQQFHEYLSTVFLGCHVEWGAFGSDDIEVDGRLVDQLLDVIDVLEVDGELDG